MGMAESHRCRGHGKTAAVPIPDPRAAIAARQSGPEPAQEPELTGVVLDPAAARKRARDERFQASEL